MKDDFAWDVFDDGVLILCFKNKAELDLEEIIKSALLYSQWPRPIKVQVGYLSEHLLPQDHKIMRYVIPITAFDIDPTIVVEILRYKIEIMVFVNIDTVKRSLVQAGFDVNIINERRMIIRGPSRTEMKLLSRPWSWLVYALLTLPSFINNIIKDFEEAERVGPSITRKSFFADFSEVD